MSVLEALTVALVIVSMGLAAVFVTLAARNLSRAAHYCEMARRAETCKHEEWELLERLDPIAVRRRCVNCGAPGAVFLPDPTDPRALAHAARMPPDYIARFGPAGSGITQKEA